MHDADSAVTTQFYSPGAVYCITPTTEDLARKMGAQSKPRPVARYELEPPWQPAGTGAAADEGLIGSELP